MKTYQHKEKITQARRPHTGGKASIADMRSKSAVQRQLITQQKPGEEDELLQGRFIQRQTSEEEELVQGRFIQRQASEEEELVQGRFIQRQANEEEELVQGKMKQPIQRNRTGLPDNLKSGMENLSGFSLDHVKVHYNSAKPAAVQAHAYAQGSDIHLASGQEKHLPHELGHVVQQMQGRVQATTNVAGMAVNDSPALEKEADSMGARAMNHY